MKVAVVVLTLNEEPNIKRCLEQFKPYVDHIVVLDGGSGDKTVEIASAIATQVKVKAVGGIGAELHNYAWGLVPKNIDWTLFCDADEMFHQLFTPNIKEIIKDLENKYRKIIAIRFPRANLPKCVDYPDFQVRVLKSSKGITFVNEPHPTPIINGKPVADIEGGCMTLLDQPIWHLPRRTDIRRPWW